MTADPAIIEVAARAAVRGTWTERTLDDVALAVLAAVTPLIRAAALEEAAKVAAAYTGVGWDIAAAIRAQKEQP